MCTPNKHQILVDLMHDYTFIFLGKLFLCYVSTLLEIGSATETAFSTFVSGLKRTFYVFLFICILVHGEENQKIFRSSTSFC